MSRSNLYFVVIGGILTLTFLTTPLLVGLMNLVQPCMPPLLSSVMILDCKDWEHDGDSGFWMRLALGIAEFYAWMLTIGMIGISVYITLLFPVEIKLLLLEVLVK